MARCKSGHQRYLCIACQQTFSENFDSLYYRRHVSTEQIQQVLQAQARMQQFTWGESDYWTG